MSLREWTVAGGLIETDSGVLLVRNQRRGGFEDWSTPGGVIDAEDPDLLAGLSREVAEETGLIVTEWRGPLYEVHAVAPDMGWVMRAHVFRAVAFEGEVRVDDPDGIVVEAEFVPHDRCLVLLAEGARWIHEPLADWIAERWGVAEHRGYRYEVRGVARGELEVERKP
jgi:ADP-ribose pyrophosphatase YjhB (NUDIX family)